MAAIKNDILTNDYLRHISPINLN